MIQILQRFSIQTRLFLAIGLLLLPLGFGMWTNISHARESVEFSNKEMGGITHFRKLFPLLKTMQESRGLANGTLSGNVMMRERLDAKVQEVDQHLKAMLDDQATAAGLKQADREAEIAKTWVDYKSKLYSKTAKHSFDEVTGIIASLLLAIEGTADESNLILDPETESYYFMYASVILLPKLSERLGQLRAIGTGIAARKQITDAERLDLAVRYGLAAKEAADIRKSLAKVDQYSTDATRKQIDDFQGKVDNLLPLLHHNLIEPVAPTIDAETVFDTATGTIVSGFILCAAGTDLLEIAINKRLTNEKVSITQVAGITLALLLLTIAIQVTIVRSITRPLRLAVQRVQGLAQAGADLSTRLEINTNDELRDLADGINQFMDHLRQIIIQIAQNAKQASASAVTLEGTALQFADSVKNQAASSEQSSASTEQVVASVTGIVENIAQQTNRIQEIDRKMSGFSTALGSLSQSMRNFYAVSETTAEKAQLGDAAARQASEAMDRISEISRRIEEIVAVIGDISDQTDLLSLNASIEAARAGDAGRGFAVVSSEITKLSEKTANNAHDIRKLIGEAGSTVHNGAGQVRQLTAYLAEMIESVRSATRTLSEMNNVLSEQSETARGIAQNTGQIRALAQDVEHSAVEQKRAIQEIGQAIEVMSKETQNIVQSSEALTTASRQVLDVSRALEALVGSFKL